MKTVLSVGQCQLDGPQIEKLLQENCEAEVETAINIKETLEKVTEKTFDLVLANRIFDKNHESGLELIEKLHESHPEQKTMLVNNYDDVQKEAVEKGAVKGFGKKALQSLETINTLRNALGLKQNKKYDDPSRQTDLNICPAE